MNSSGGGNTMAPAMTAVKSETPSIIVADCDSGGTVLTNLEPVRLHDGAYNLNVNVNLTAPNSAVTNLMAAESGGNTPRTPEILNSVIAMTTNPLDQYTYAGAQRKLVGLKNINGNDSNSSMSNNSSASASPSPANLTATPSVQKTCSDLIKAGLKLSIESKRKFSGSECSESGNSGFGCFKRFKKEEDPSDEDYDSSHTQVSRSESTLTPEDEERRKRRRERNKIAATKCRLKKRERTVNLVHESEVLEIQNVELKTQLQQLELQSKQLADMLSHHSPVCVKKNYPGSPSNNYNHNRPYDSPTSFTQFDNSSPYIRPESANILASSYTCMTPLEPMNDNSFITQLDADYQSSVLNIPEPMYTVDGFLQKNNYLIIEPEDEYQYQPDRFQTTQCHNFNQNMSEPQGKKRNLNDSNCIA